MKKINKLLNPDREFSLFKTKVYYYPVEGKTGESTYWSHDFMEERRNFEQNQEYFESQGQQKKYLVFSSFNGFRKQMDFLNKLHNDGKLKVGIIYLNKVYEQTAGGVGMPMELLKVISET